MVEHKLKIKSEHFMDVAKGAKKAEIRYNDRNYQVGSWHAWGNECKNDIQL